MPDGSEQPPKRSRSEDTAGGLEGQPERWSMVPVFLPAAPIVPHAVLDEEKEILRSEGYFHVRGLYFANAFDADKMRRREAERRVAARERLAALPACAFCFEKIGGQVAVVIAMKPVHPACAQRFDAWIAGHPSENDTRWKDVTDDTLVDFDGEMTRWGDLMVQDRKTVDMLPDGRLVGGYPL